jgi:serine/threonine protein kinase
VSFPAEVQDVLGFFLGQLEFCRRASDKLESSGRLRAGGVPVPSGILLDGKPEVDEYKVADFGVAKWTGSAVHTETGIMLGTPAYLSPQRLRGLAPAFESDLYALGVMLFEGLTGCLPFQAELDVQRGWARGCYSTASN